MTTLPPQQAGHYWAREPGGRPFPVAVTLQLDGLHVARCGMSSMPMREAVARWWVWLGPAVPPAETPLGCMTRDQAFAAAAYSTPGL